MRSTRGLPEGGRAAHVLCVTLLQVGFAKPYGLPRTLVRSYRTVSPLPPKLPPTAVCFLLHFP